MLTVLVHDRRRLVREGLTAVLGHEIDMVVLGVSGLPQELASLLTRERVDVVLLGSGAEPRDVTTCFAGRCVQLEDDEPVEVLLANLRGQMASRRGDSSGDSMPATKQPQTWPLTFREVEVLQCLARGLSSAHVALALGISRKTVDSHKQRIYAKLSVRSQGHAVALAIKAGLLDINAPAGGTSEGDG